MKIRRRKFIVDAGLQMRFTLFFVLASLVANAVALTVFNILAFKRLDSVMWSTHISVAATDELISPLFIYINIINFIFVTVLLFFTGHWILGKTAGPLNRMTKDIKSITDGDLSSRIVLRQKDDLKDVAKELNRMTERLKERFSNIKNQYNGISESIGILKKRIGNKEDTITNCNSIIESIEELEREINKFTVTEK